MADEKEVQKLFRVTPEEDAQLDQLVELAFRLGFITEKTIQKYMMFCLNLAYTTLKDAYLKMTAGH